MKKTAPAAHPVNELIRDRWSPRSFAQRPVEPRKLRSVLEAGRWAPSSYNEQPWFFLIARREDEADFQKMLGCLIEFNQSWAKAAGVLIISVAKKTFDRNGKENRHAAHDVGLASENMALEAVAQGLATHGMAGIEVDKIREAYQLPENCEPMAAWALGYPGEPDQLPAELRDRELDPRVRKELKDFIFSEKFGNPAAVLSSQD